MNSFAWLAWAFAAMAVVLVMRNPWIIAEMVIVVLSVRLAWSGSGGSGVGWLLRLSFGFGLVSVVFNALTVHSGDQVLVTIPASVPGLGGTITVNAIAYGVVSAAGMIALVVAGFTASERVVWAEVFRALPAALEPVAVSTSVAWTFLPQVRLAWQNIREAQAMRGLEIRGVRSFIRVIVPLMGSALDRSLVVAEALEARGYGATPSDSVRTNAGLSLLIISISALVAFSVTAVSGTWTLAALCAFVGVLSGALALRRLGASQGHRTRYRKASWSAVDRAVIVASILALIVMLGTVASAPTTRTFPAYPDLVLPVAPLPLMVALCGLMLPAWWAPKAGER